MFDEAVSALDVSVRAQILRLILDLQQRFGLSYVFISHDLGVVKRVWDRIAVMYLGRIVEIGPADELVQAPLHPYTDALLRAIPIADPRRMRVRDLGLAEGERSRKPLALSVPRPLSAPDAALRQRRPALADITAGRRAACFLTDPATEKTHDRLKIVVTGFEAFAHGTENPTLAVLDQLEAANDLPGDLATVRVPVDSNSCQHR